MEKKPLPVRAVALQQNTEVAQIKNLWDSDSKARLSEALSLVCTLQKSYGKTPDQLHTMVAGFAWALADFEPEAVFSALKIYIRRKNDVPAPADIIAILAPEPEIWSPDWSVYNRYKEMLAKEGKYALTPEEKKYMAMCEEWSLSRGASVSVETSGEGVSRDKRKR